MIKLELTSRILFLLAIVVFIHRKEITSLRGGNGNEAKNEKLRVRWLGSAVTELQGEVAEVLRTRNVSEELAERSRMKGELALLKGDVAAVGKGIRNLGGRITKIEAVLGTIRVDIAAMKERFSLLFRTYADVSSQLNSIQIEVKSLKCDSSSVNVNSLIEHRVNVERGEEGREREMEKKTRTVTAGTVVGTVSSYFGESSTGNSDPKTTAVASHSVPRHRLVRKHYLKQKGYRMRLNDRLKSLEHKIFLTMRERASLEKRITTYENQEWSGLSKRIKSLEKAQIELSEKISNISNENNIDESLGSLFDSLRSLEDVMERNNSSTKWELMRLGVNAAQKAAELSLTREELNNLRRTVQALSVSASKLQEKSDKQEKVIDRLNATCSIIDFHRSSITSFISSSLESSNDAFSNFEELEDRYHLIRHNLTSDCVQNEPINEPMDGLRLLKAGKEGRPILVFCHEGWIVIARRIDGTLDFDRNWNDYSLGFGSPVSEYWIGNEFLHRLTNSDNCTSLRIDMLDIYGQHWRAEYDSFKIESKENGYKLNVYGYSGNATDALSYQNGMAFSAKDRDMDTSTTHCAKNYHGGWWFSRCQHANLNGKYSLGLTWFRSDINQWMSIASSEMSIRRNTDCRS